MAHQYAQQVKMCRLFHYDCVSSSQVLQINILTCTNDYYGYFFDFQKKKILISRTIKRIRRSSIHPLELPQIIPNASQYNSHTPTGAHQPTEATSPPHPLLPTAPPRETIIEIEHQTEESPVLISKSVTHASRGRKSEELVSAKIRSFKGNVTSKS